MKPTNPSESSPLEKGVEKSDNELIAEIIESELGYTNGWSISDADYLKHCLNCANRIIQLLKPSKEETQLRSAEEILADVMDRHGIYLSVYSAERRCALEAAELYASQFKPSGVKTFSVEDMRAAFYAGKDHTADEYRDGETIGFDEWIKTRK